MFEKIVAIEPVNLVPAARERLREFAVDVEFFDTVPQTDEEIVARIGNADAVLVSYTTRVGRAVIEALPQVRYIGMCCSLYSEDSANVAIPAARERGIVVKGVRDYGDPGVVEYVICELVRYLHGFDRPGWHAGQVEIGGLSCGIVGLGTTGTLIACALRSFGAEVSYYSRTRKPEQEAVGVRYRPLDDLLATSDAVFTCLNKNVILLGEEQFARLGDHKMLFNTSIGPGHEVTALARWLEHGDNEFFCDMPCALSEKGEAEPLLQNPHVNCVRKSSGSTEQAAARLGEKVIANIESFLREEPCNR